MTASYLGKQPNSFLERKNPLMKKTFTKQFIENKMDVKYRSVLNMKQKYQNSQMKKVGDNIKFQNREFRHWLEDIRNTGR